MGKVMKINQHAPAAVKEALDKKEVREKDTGISRRSKIAAVFCKAYEKACLETHQSDWRKLPAPTGACGNETE